MSPFPHQALIPDLSALRRRVRALRRRLSPQQQRDHSLRVARRLRTLPAFRRAERVALYLSMDGEVDLAPLIRDLWDRGRRCYLPVLRRTRPGRLWFVEYRPGQCLVANKYRIPEPALTSAPRVPPWGLDLILLPLVAFDHQCRRLGMGGGYYDRSLAYLRQRTSWRSPRLLGIAHECQRVDQLIPRPWDIRLQAVVTEQGCYDCGFLNRSSSGRSLQGLRGQGPDQMGVDDKG